MLYWPSDTVSPVRLYRRIYYYFTHTHTQKKKKASEPWRICAYRCRHPRVPSVQGRVPGAPPLPSILNIFFICRRFYSQGLFAKKKTRRSITQLVPRLPCVIELKSTSLLPFILITHVYTMYRARNETLRHLYELYTHNKVLAFGNLYV